MKKALLRNVVAVGLMIVFSGFTAFLGWYSLAGVAMAYGFFFFTPLIVAIVTKREIELSLMYVFLSLAIYLTGLYHWDYLDKSWKEWWYDTSGIGAKNQAELVGMCLFCALFPATPIYLVRRFPL